MGIKYNERAKTYEVQYSKRHPITRVPYQIKRKSIKTQAEANRVLAEIIGLVNERIKKRLVPTWRNFLNSYLESLELTDVTRTTRYNREKIINYYTFPAWEEKLVDEISTEDIYKLLNDRMKDKAESYRKFFIKCLRGAFNYALDRQLISRNPTPNIKFKIKSKIKSVLNEEQILILLRKAQEQNWCWYPHYSVALFTGLRNGELYALTWDQVNLERRQILVNRSWSSKDGFKSTKSGNDRIVEIPNTLMPLLRELKLGSASSDFVLPRLNRWDRGEQAYDLRLFLRAIGLHEVRFHDLRASWATLLLNKGVAPGQVMVMGGWSDINTMMIYMRKAGIDIRNTTSVLDGIKTHGISEAKVIDFRQM